MKAGRTELDSLKNTGTVTAVSSEKKEELRREARATGQQFVELPSKGVFTIKPDKYKVRIVACGNKTADTYGRVSTTDLDAAMLRYILSLHLLTSLLLPWMLRRLSSMHHCLR